MKALILLATLKKEEQSNTQLLCEFFTRFSDKENIETEIIKLVDYNILPGTYSNMGNDDAWPEILKKILAADILIFATPVWWGCQSSQMQMVFERLDELHDEILQGKESKLYGKAGGVIVTGDSDGAQHIIANIANFYSALGINFPAFATLTVLWEGLAKSENRSREEIMKKFEKDYSSTAEKMAKQLSTTAHTIKHYQNS